LVPYLGKEENYLTSQVLRFTLKKERIDAARPGTRVLWEGKRYELTVFKGGKRPHIW